ncbi:MAG: hypothetical protein ACHQUC_01490 [Chlamydiales bacterium]
MNLLVNYPPYFAYHFGTRFVAFRREDGAIFAEEGSLFSTQRKTATLVEPIFKHPPSFEHNNLTKIDLIGKLLVEGYFPRIKGDTIRLHFPWSDFNSSDCSSSGQTSKRSIREKEEFKALLKNFDQAIEQMFDLIGAGSANKGILLTCPITGELFRQPVVDRIGHTFEEDALEKWVRKGGGYPHGKCPVGLENITLPLAPNRLVKDLVTDLVDKRRQKSIIPLLPKMEGKPVDEDIDKGTRFIKLAKEFAETNDFQTAIEMLTKAFPFTSKTEDFLPLPIYYKAVNETQKAVLAYLYLAKQQAIEGHLDAAESSLNAALDLNPHLEFIQAAFAATLMMRGKKQEAATIFYRLAESILHLESKALPHLLLSNANELNKGALNSCNENEERSQTREIPILNERSRKLALDYLELAIFCDPMCCQFYLKAAALCEPEAKICLFTKGMLQLHGTQPEKSDYLYEEMTTLFPDNPLPYLARLSIVEARFNLIEEKGDEYHFLHRKIASLLQEEAHFLHRKLASLLPEEELALAEYHLAEAAKSNQDEDLRAYLHHLKKTTNIKKAKRVYLQWIDRLESPPEELIQEAIQTVGRRTSLLQRLLPLYLRMRNPSLPSLIQELGAIYETKCNLSAAEAIYRVAYDTFKTFETKVRWMEQVAKTDKEKGGALFLREAKIAHAREDYHQLTVCLKQIVTIQSETELFNCEDRDSFRLLLAISKLFQRNAELQAEKKETEDSMIANRLNNTRLIEAKSQESKRQMAQLKSTIATLRAEIGSTNYRSVEYAQQSRGSSLYRIITELDSCKTQYEENAKVYREKRQGELKKEMQELKNEMSKYQKEMQQLYRDMERYGGRRERDGITTLEKAIQLRGEKFQRLNEELRRLEEESQSYRYSMYPY